MACVALGWGAPPASSLAELGTSALRSRPSMCIEVCTCIEVHAAQGARARTQRGAELCTLTLRNGYYSHYRPVDGPEFEQRRHDERDTWSYWKQLPRESREYTLWPLYGYDDSAPDVIAAYLREYAANSSLATALPSPVEE
eukprot:7240739-Prymnesium_polylepis.2